MDIYCRQKFSNSFYMIHCIAWVNNMRYFLQQIINTIFSLNSRAHIFRANSAQYDLQWQVKIWVGMKWVYDLGMKVKVGAGTSHCWCRPTVSWPICRVSTRSMVEWSMISYIKQWYEMIVLWGVVDGGQMETDGSNLFVGCYTLQGIWSCMIITLLRQGTIG